MDVMTDDMSSAGVRGGGGGDAWWEQSVSVCISFIQYESSFKHTTETG